MVAVSLFWSTIMPAMTSCQNHLVIDGIMFRWEDTKAEYPVVYKSWGALVSFAIEREVASSFETSYSGLPTSPHPTVLYMPQFDRNLLSTQLDLDLWFFLSPVSRAPEERENINVPYLNPLVLRKELENMFENDGIDTLQSPDVVQEKRIIFWNLVGHLPYIKFRLISQFVKRVYTLFQNGGQ